MSVRKQPKPDTLTTVINEVEEDHYRTKNWVAREWLPIIGLQAIGLYNIYSSAANKERGNKWFFSIRTLEEYTFMDKSTINMANWLLELCGLIGVNTGKDGYANEYVLLTPPHVTPEILAPIIATLKAESDVGKNWRAFKANVLARIMKWKPLHECGKASQFKKGMNEAKTQPPATNGHAPQADDPALVSHIELVLWLVNHFKNDESSLSEAAAIKMIEQYGLEAVVQQLRWLEGRETDNPLRTLRAALKDDWSEPKPVGKAEPEPWFKGTHLDPTMNNNHSLS